MLTLSNLPKTKEKKKKRVGRGNASNGTYSGRGMKGQRSRSGGKGGLKRLGAQSWISKLPKKKGFKSRNEKPERVDIKTLDNKFENNTLITPKLLKTSGLISKTSAGVKLLGNGTIKKKLTIKGFYLSKNAKQAIEKAGGKIENELTKKELKKNQVDTEKKEEKSSK